MHSQSVSHIALELKEDYLKAYVRRAQAYEALEKYEDALEGSCMSKYEYVYGECALCLLDYKKALELDPSLVAARQAMMVSRTYYRRKQKWRCMYILAVLARENQRTAGEAQGRNARYVGRQCHSYIARQSSCLSFRQAEGVGECRPQTIWTIN